MNDYSIRINRVIDYIERNLDRTLTLDELASIANFSKYHFHRIFSSFTGETLSGFIQRHRLETAAAKLARNSRTSITEIALSCGFSSSASFSNSFKKYFRVSPSLWRKENADYIPDSNLNEIKGNSDKERSGSLFHIEYEKDIQIWRTVNEKLEKTVTVKSIPPLTLAYLRYVGPYKGNDRLFEELWNKLMRWAGPRGFLGSEETWFMTLYHNYPDLTEDDKLRLSVCLSVPEDTETGRGMGIMVFDGGKYACYECVLGPEDYQHAWNWLYREWLPYSGFQPSDGTPAEIYPSDQKCLPPGKQRVIISIPVIPL